MVLTSFQLQIEILDTRRSRKGGKQTRLKKPPSKEPEKPTVDNDPDLLGKFLGNRKT